ncbi:MAG: glycosyltransferase family 4 protein [Chitinophagaceae bacterium]|nr:glycosyltransferase family 4 protein [Chitinophagaceae bacterium]
MHIAFVTPEFLRGDQLYPGGLSTYTFNTATALQALGHQVTIFLSGDTDREIAFRGIRVIERRTRIPWYLMPIHLLLKRWLSDGLDRCWASLTINRALRDRISVDRIDIVHYTNWKAIGLFRVSHPSILRISSYDPHLARYIEQDLGLKRPIELLPTPVDIRTGQRQEVSDSIQVKRRKKVLYAGSVSHIKGAALLFEIIETYLKRHDDTDFVIAGKAGVVNGRSCKEHLRLFSEMFPDHFQYHPHLERSMLDSEYATADLVIIPSLIDNFPNTALEAMSHGTLVLASDTASLGTLLKDGDNGFVMKGRDPLEWMERIRKILFDLPGDERKAMSVRMLKALSAHDKDQAIRRLLSVYQDTVNKR